MSHKAFLGALGGSRSLCCVAGQKSSGEPLQGPFHGPRPPVHTNSDVPLPAAQVLSVHKILFTLSSGRFCPSCQIPDSEDIRAALHTCGDEGRVAGKSTLLQELQEQSTGQTQVCGRVSSEELNICPRLILAMLINIRRKCGCRS